MPRQREDRIGKGCARVCTSEQNLDMQIILFDDVGCEKIYEESVS
ncbi:hypothetical protein [Legionella micdadei]|uniref:Resolvase/invertase-type recombinase catalytic domain-containing protein n=1 Tax=Legionella micdadei TaxID=451 RepID=A0A098GE40_LEGMI|nr:hypothetical protein [Legionella micdadei]CEG60250.1 protein of unknown function [Legionella micdadei]SCY57822.1 hypothetical protein SAMN02982997_02130 [Legionella micdadei]